jgi:hypothetical protein
MGLATHNPGGETRLGLSATAASAVMYGAIVLFGLGSASPSALDFHRDRHASVVLIPPHADTVVGSAQRLPPASPEPGRHRPRVRQDQSRPGVRPTTPLPAPSTGGIAPAPVLPRVTESAANSVNATPVAVQLPTVAAPMVSVPELRVQLPELPVQLPELSLLLQLDLPG